MDNPILTQWLTQPDGLATRLNQIRKVAGLSGRDLAERLGWTPSKVSRIQTGKILISHDDLPAWLEACDASHHISELTELLHQANAHHIPWRQRLARGHGGIQAAYNQLMASSRLVTLVEMATIPRPVQTEGYARAMLSAFSRLWPNSPQDIEAGVQARLARGAQPDGDGPDLELIINEAALLGAPADRPILDDQLDHLLIVADYPGVDLKLLELTPGMHVVPVNSFNWYHLTNGTDLVLVETYSGESEMWDTDIDLYRQALDWLRAAAVAGDDAKRIINRARWRP